MNADYITTALNFFMLFGTLISIGFYFLHSLCLQAIADKLDCEYSWVAWVPYFQFYLPHVLSGQSWTLFTFAFFIAPVAAMGFAFLGIIVLALIFFFMPFFYIVFLYGGMAYRRQLPIWLGVLCLVPGLGIIPFAYIAFHDGFGIKPFWPGAILVGMIGVVVAVPSEDLPHTQETRELETLVRELMKNKDQIMDQEFVKTVSKNTAPILEKIENAAEDTTATVSKTTQSLPDPKREIHAQKSCPPSLEEKGGRPPEQFESWCAVPGQPDSRHGDYWEWGLDGSLITFGSYVKNKRNGEWFRWYRNGIKKATAEYENGKQVGAYNLWNQDGTLQETVLFKDGKAYSE
jgi:hypothetical protein